MLLTTRPTSTPSFYIARVGSLCGKPMKELTYNPTNVFSVYSDNVEADFQKVKAAFEMGLFAIYAHGTCHPSLRIGDVKSVLENMPTASDREVDGLVKTQNMIELLEQQLQTYKQLHTGLQHKVFCK